VSFRYPAISGTFFRKQNKEPVYREDPDPDCDLDLSQIIMDPDPRNLTKPLPNWNITFSVSSSCFPPASCYLIDRQAVLWILIRMFLALSDPDQSLFFTDPESFYLQAKRVRKTLISTILTFKKKFYHEN
jgi:hypothetical protein